MSEKKYGVLRKIPYESYVIWFETMEEAIQEYHRLNFNDDCTHIVIKVDIITKVVNPLTQESYEVTK